MPDRDQLHPSHLPMIIAADLAEASELLRKAWVHADRAMRGLNIHCGVKGDAYEISAWAAKYDAMRKLLMESETEEADERLRRARAL